MQYTVTNLIVFRIDHRLIIHTLVFNSLGDFLRWCLQEKSEYNGCKENTNKQTNKTMKLAHSLSKQSVQADTGTLEIGHFSLNVL